LMETQPFILANVGINVPLVVFREKCIFWDVRPRRKSASVLEQYQLTVTNLCDTISYISRHVFSSLSRWMPGQNLEIGHSKFLLYNFQFIAPESS
jgi:hypothetical protein